MVRRGTEGDSRLRQSFDVCGPPWNGDEAGACVQSRDDVPYSGRQTLRIIPLTCSTVSGVKFISGWATEACS
jgi:hypothetical protein